MVEEVITELRPSEEDALEGRKPGRCEGPTLSNGGRWGSGATTGARALDVVRVTSELSKRLSGWPLALLGAERAG
jgi:hypothetical protein